MYTSDPPHWAAALFRQFLGEYVENHIPFDQTTAHFHELTAFYAQSAMDLAQKLLQTGQLADWETRRNHPKKEG
jgi:hypothetical protein